MFNTMGDELIALGYAIKLRRNEIGMTAQMLADKCFCTIDWVFKVESGKCRPSIPLMKLMFNELGIPLRFDEFKTIIEEHRLK